MATTPCQRATDERRAQPAWMPEHRPASWVVVAQASDAVVVHAMCVCGDDACAFTATAYDTSWVATR